MQNIFYFNTSVQSVISEQLKRVMGVFNKEDATQEAYVAITDENPITSEEACNCVERAICRYRKRISKISKHEQRDQDSWIDNTEGYYNSDTDDSNKGQYWWDYIAPKTPVFSATKRKAVDKILKDLGRTY